MSRIPATAAPCGIFCGACPSLGKTCNGCGSEDRNQKRRSKWGCRVRKCCFEIKNIDFCYKCDEFPCDKFRAKLSESHPNDKRFKYRQETINNLKRIEQVGVDSWLAEEDKRWTCSKCGALFNWYYYKCSKCDHEQYI